MLSISSAGRKDTLINRGQFVSSTGVRSVWVRNNLQTVARRVKALAQIQRPASPSPQPRETAIATPQSDGGGNQVCPEPMDGAERVLLRRTVPIDNNVSGREIKRVVLTRKNSLFGESVRRQSRGHPVQLDQRQLDFPAALTHHFCYLARPVAS